MYILLWVLIFGESITSGTREFSSKESCEKVAESLRATKTYKFNSHSLAECYKE